MKLEIGWRLYYGLYRLISASAKLHLRDIATMEDVKVVQRIVMASIESLKFDGKVKMKSKKQTKSDVFLTAWSDCSDEDDTIEQDVFVSLLAQTDPFNALTAGSEFEKHKQSGNIQLVNKTGRYRFI